MALPASLLDLDLRRDWRVVLVGLLCGYEVVALTAHSDRLPTLTEVAWRLRSHKLGRFVLWLIFGWLIEHIFGEGR